MHDELLTLRNLGKTSAQWLHASGIHTADDLRRLGAVSAYASSELAGLGQLIDATMNSDRVINFG